MTLGAGRRSGGYSHSDGPVRHGRALHGQAHSARDVRRLPEAAQDKTLLPRRETFRLPAGATRPASHVLWPSHCSSLSCLLWPTLAAGPGRQPMPGAHRRRGHHQRRILQLLPQQPRRHPGEARASATCADPELLRMDDLFAKQLRSSS